ncbi:hypothetical protein QVD17_17324 [Tagetes erecta]|uniref:Uncharacterized protein n=1 Tax=Tagetes erecta TaxID=13708 RepID=A0AAD8KS30_TARER|nr:hypothetical protein QVD17_17324 [Tagetes erecta]
MTNMPLGTILAINSFKNKNLFHHHLQPPPPPPPHHYCCNSHNYHHLPTLSKFRPVDFATDRLIALNLYNNQMMPRGKVYRYPPGRNAPDPSMGGIGGGGMVSVPYDMSGVNESFHCAMLQSHNQFLLVL